MKLDPDLHGAGHLEEAGCTRALKDEIRIREVMDDHDAMFPGPGHDVLEEFYVGNRRGVSQILIGD